MPKMLNYVNIDIIQTLAIATYFCLTEGTVAHQENKFAVRSKIWLEDSSGKVAFGLGRLRILEAIDRLGSMNSAAVELSMSYRSVWCRIRESEDRIGRRLVVRKGKGSVLTAFARRLLQQFTELDGKLQAEADTIFGNLIEDAGDPEK
jgi:molybdate transport system regulatory protein